MQSSGNIGYAPFSSPTARKGLFCLFLVSLVMDADVLLSPILIDQGMIRPHTWGGGIHILIGIIETALMVGGTVLWLLMLYFCMRY